jgi:hypothetical protein
MTRNSQARRQRRAANRPASELDETEALRREIADRVEALAQGGTAAPPPADKGQSRRQQRRQRGRMPADDPAHALRGELATRFFRLAQSMEKES